MADQPTASRRLSSAVATVTLLILAALPASFAIGSWYCGAHCCSAPGQFAVSSALFIVTGEVVLVMRWLRRGSSLGFGLASTVGFLVVAAFVLFGLLLEPLTGAVDRGRQMRTVSQIRELGSALESYRLTVGSYPVINEATLERLAPIYLDVRPGDRRLRLDGRRLLDGWSNPLQLTCGGDACRIVSYGMCGQPDDEAGRDGTTSMFSDDVVWSRGRLVRHASGLQQ